MPDASHESHAFRLTRPTRMLAGAGLFSAQPAEVRFLPAQAGSGITLRRLHDGGCAEGPAHVSLVTTDATWAGLPAGVPVRNTTLALTTPAGTLPLATVEHALGALAGLGVRDAIVEVRGVEVPILDGSAREFCEALREVLEEAPSCGAAPIVLTRPVSVRDDRSGATITASPPAPGQQPTFAYHLDYAPRAVPAPATASWTAGARASAADFAVDVAPARTFSLRSEAHAARRAGLFAHLTPAEMLVLDDDTGLPLDNALRFTDEPARHKLLDLLGDLLLLGAPLRAHVVSHRGGHALTHELCRAILRECIAPNVAKG